MRFLRRAGTLAIGCAAMVGLGLGGPAWANPGSSTEAILAASAGIAAAAPASAPVDIGTTQIDDLAGVGAETAAATDAIATLRAEAHINLYVVLVDTFGDLDKTSWAHQSFTASDLGSNDALLAVAVSDRRFGYWAGVTGQDFAVAPDTVKKIFTDDAAPHLSTQDWSGAIVAAAQGLQAAATGSASAGSTDSGASNGSNLGWLWLVLVIGAGAGGYLWYRSSQRKKAAALAAPAQAGPPLEDYDKLSARSVNALIQTDNAVQSSESELQLAEGEFGTAATAEFRAAHAEAKSKLTEAFQLRQEIDDEIPESTDTRRGWMEQIISLCNEGMTALQAQTEKFAGLRDIAARLPAVLSAIPTAIDGQATRLPAAAATLQRLSGAYSAAAVSTVVSNPDQANERLEYARTALAESKRAQTGSDGGAAVIAARAAQEAVAQATTLLDAIDRIDRDLAAAATKVTAERDAVVAELATVSAALRGGSAGGDQDDILHRLAAISAVVAQSKSPEANRDPLSTLKALNDADLALDDILADTRTAQQREARARAALDNELSSAASTVSAVDDFISTRRGAVASTARTRLAEAHRHLAEAQSLADTDARKALVEAQQATSLARQAYQEAQDDMDQWTGGGYGRRSSMGGVGGGLLGGIIIGSLLGGHGGFGGGWGGGGFGGGGGGFGGGGGGGFGGGFGGGGSF